MAEKLTGDQIISNTFVLATTDEQLMRLTSILDDSLDYLSSLNKGDYKTAEKILQKSLDSRNINKEDYDLAISKIPS